MGLQSIFPGIFSSEGVEDTVELHCRLFCLQYACAKSWLDCGLEVDTLIGHSFGQLTALCVADALSLEDSIRLTSTRARLIRDQWGPETGAMLAVEGARQDMEALLDSVKKQHPSYSAEISCYNGPKNFVLAGDNASIKAIEAALGTEEFSMSLKSQKLKNTHAFHSRLVDGILPGLREMAESVQFRKPSLRIETCSTGQSWSNVDASKIIDHSRKPVYFADAVERIAARSKSSIWLEAGSRSSIIAMIRRVLQIESTAKHTLQPIDLASTKAQSNLASASSELWAAGSKAQFWQFHNCQKTSYSWINLPPYHFKKTQHWMQYKASPGLSSEATALPVDHEPELLHKLDGDSIEALFSIDTTHIIFTMCTKGHAVLNHSLCPASMYFELAIRAARLVAEPASSSSLPRIRELKISSPLSLSPAGSGTVVLRRYVANILDQLDNDREVQILELGAGTGGTTSFLVELLAGYERKFQYTFTDVSSSLVVAAKKRFAHHSFMKYTTLDIEQVPPAQHLGQYDIIISTNCVHATKNLTASTANVKSMLRQDGILCLVELTQNLFWFDLVFGLLEGWWLFNDGRKHVLANERLWEQHLYEAGFQWVDWTDGDSEESQILRVIVASPSRAYQPVPQSCSNDSIDRLETQETVGFDENGTPQLLADIYYPDKLDGTNTTRPVGEAF